MKRDSRYELLRIISMLMIVVCHVVLVPTHLVPGSESLTVIKNNFLNSQIAQSVGMFGRVGNLLFVMISGYFMVNMNFKRERIYSLMNKVHMYVWPFIPILILTGRTKSVKEWFSFFWPILSRQYWFVTAFLALMLFAPFINKLLHVISYKQAITLLLLLFLVLTFFPTLTLDVV